MEPVAELRVGPHRLRLRPTAVGYQLVCEREGAASEVLLLPGAVSAWAGVGDSRLLLAQDDRLVSYELPTLEVLGRARVDENINRIAVHPDGTWATLATGMNGNFETHGNLLHLELDTWQTRPLLEVDREVVDCEIRPDGSVRFVLGWADEVDDRHHEGHVVPAAARAALGPLRLLSAAEQAALERRGEPA